MFGGNFEYEDESGNKWSGLPYDPDSRLTDAAGSREQFNDLSNMSKDFGWSNWSDFYNDKLGLSNNNPEASRTPFLGSLVDLAIDLYGRGILDYSRFNMNGDYVEYEVDVDS